MKIRLQTEIEPDAPLTKVEKIALVLLVVSPILFVLMANLIFRLSE